MSLRIHQLWLAVLAGFLGAASARATAGYLPLTGPLPLRFRAAPPPPVMMVAPPPVPTHPALPPIELPSPPMPRAPAEANNVPPAKPAAPKIPAVTNAPPAVEFDARDPLADSKLPAAPEGMVSPQMLIKFFTGPLSAPTNTASAPVSGPVGFTPPAPSGKAAPAASP